MTHSYDYFLISAKISFFKKGSIVEIPSYTPFVYLPEIDESFEYMEELNRRSFRYESRKPDYDKSKKHFHKILINEITDLEEKDERNEKNVYSSEYYYYAIAKRDTFVFEYIKPLDIPIFPSDGFDDIMEWVSDDRENYNMAKLLYEDHKEELKEKILKCNKLNGSFNYLTSLLFGSWSYYDSYAGDADGGVNYIGVFDYDKYNAEFQNVCKKYIKTTDHEKVAREAEEKYWKQWEGYMEESISEEL